MQRLVAAAVVLTYFVGPARNAPGGDELAVLSAGRRPLLYDHLLTEVARQSAARQQAVSTALQSPAALAARREKLRSDLRELVGPVPQRTPLHARTVGTIDCDGYRIERVLYESRPGHHVTANLYLPADTARPVPGVLVPCGHSANGKASEFYQSECVLLALNGCAALIYDPIGQGERNQLPDAVKHGTNEHTLVGIGALLVGWNTATFRIWDGVRGLDYLASRSEIDPQRLSCTGNSGGGTLTTWLMAYDERIAVAAPSCFITTLDRLFHTIGPQDCEQHFPGQGPLGIDHTDFITMRAPKPTLILAAEQDFFDFGGTRTAAKEAEAVYRLLGHPERVGLFSYNDEHGFSRPRREAAVHWMRRWLLDDDRPVVEPTLMLQKDADLQVTAVGQVVKEFADEKTVVDFCNERATRLAESRRMTWESMDEGQRLATIRQVIALPTDLNLAVQSHSIGTLDRDGYTIEKLQLDRPGQVPLPALLCVPKAATGKLPAVIYADSSGKEAGLQPGGPIERELAKKHVVLAIDLRGYGETSDVASGGKYLNDEFRTAMLAMHVGRPLVGQRVEDLLVAVEFLAHHSAVNIDKLQLNGAGRAGPVALHAALIEPRLKSVTVQNSIGSWTDDVVARPLVPQMLELAVPGVLEHYDLPDLAAMLGDRLAVEASPGSSATSNK
jgi:cephalosporin-C deacetylase-like acetyl esterase